METFIGSLLPLFLLMIGAAVLVFLVRRNASSATVRKQRPVSVDVELDELRTNLRSQASATASQPLPYKRQQYFLGSAERPFYEVLLQESIPLGFAVLAKVRLADLVYLPDNTPNRQTHFNRVSAKHVDFVLCDPLTLSPRLVIELDGPSHQRRDRRERDAFVDEVLRTVGLPIVHIPVQRQYDSAKLGATLRRELDQG